MDDLIKNLLGTLTEADKIRHTYLDCRCSLTPGKVYEFRGCVQRLVRSAYGFDADIIRAMASLAALDERRTKTFMELVASLVKTDEQDVDEWSRCLEQVLNVLSSQHLAEGVRWPPEDTMGILREYGATGRLLDAPDERLRTDQTTFLSTFLGCIEELRYLCTHALRSVCLSKSTGDGVKVRLHVMKSCLQELNDALISHCTASGPYLCGAGGPWDPCFSRCRGAGRLSIRMSHPGLFLAFEFDGSSRYQQKSVPAIESFEWYKEKLAHTWDMKTGKTHFGTGLRGVATWQSHGGRPLERIASDILALFWGRRPPTAENRVMKSVGEKVNAAATLDEHGWLDWRYFRELNDLMARFSQNRDGAEDSEGISESGRKTKEKYNSWEPPRRTCFVVDDDNRVKLHHDDKLKDLKLRTNSRAHKLFLEFHARPILLQETVKEMCSKKTKPSELVRDVNRLLNAKIAKMGFPNIPLSIQYVFFDDKLKVYRLLLPIKRPEEVNQPDNDDYIDRDGH